jgi:tetratricopeptide (TPR) repeat protein
MKESKTDVVLSEKSMDIPTYVVGEPERNPLFFTGRAYQGASGYVYPYPMMDKLTDIRETKKYKALILENKYLQIIVLPEIGGRILSAVDKTNNYNFFYRHQVIKPALIGMLGAWISGGCEWNLPHHHRATTFMPVDYTLQENSDGSKTIWVGETELHHRMKWIIGMTLYPNKSYLEVIVKLFNRTPFAHSFLYWANPAVHAGPEYQVIFPPSTQYATYHGKIQFTHWPISQEVYMGVDYRGVDISWWRNHPAPTSFFAWNYEDDFFGGYDHGKRAGVVYFANHHIAPGKKVFLWGNGPEGEMWDKILSDGEGPYLELMAGAYSDNQPDYSWIQPYEVKTVKQYWYPIREIGGIKNANLEAAVNLEVKNNKVEVGVITTTELKDAKIVLKAKEKTIFEQKVDISPEKPFVKEVPFSHEVVKEELKLSLFSSSNQEIISYQPIRKEEAPMPKPVEPPQNPKEIKTVEELYLTGLRLEQFHNSVLEPYPYYEEALRRDPGDYRVNTALGILYCKRGLFKEAEERLRVALERVTKNYTTPKDGEAYYYLMVALKFQGKYDEAYDIGYKATWYSAWNTAAHYSLAEIACIMGRYPEALEHVDSALATNVMCTKALNLRAAILRKMGRLEEAEKTVSEVLSIDPLDFWAENELYLIKRQKGLNEEAIIKLEALKKKMRENVQSHLELALDYANCGLWDEAIEVLSRLIELNKKGISNCPIIYYYLGYFLMKRGSIEEAHRYYDLGSSMPPTDYCFPFRLEEIEILKSAAEYNPRDWKIPYYLGNIYRHLGRSDEAIKEWERSKELYSGFSIVHRNLGLEYFYAKNDLHKAIKCLENAIACNKQDPRLYYELDKLYEIAGVEPEKRLMLLKNNHEVVCQRDDALSREILLYVQIGDYDEAINLLRNHHFHVWEGGGEIHDVYVDAYLLRGLTKFNNRMFKEALEDFVSALEYPENLEVGRPYRGGRFSQIFYFIGAANEQLGHDREATEFFKKSVSENVESWSDLRYYQALSLLKLGQRKEAEEIFNGLIEFANERLKTAVSLDFFAKFGEKVHEQVLRAEAYYLLGLGYLGKGDKTRAEAEFKKVIELNPYHVWAKIYLKALRENPLSLSILMPVVSPVE